VILLLKSELFKRINYIVPLFDIGGSAFDNNAGINDIVQVISNSASDTGIITLVGITHGKNDLVYETIKLNGTTAVDSVKEDWGSLYGVFLGDINGKNCSAAVGTITVRKKTGPATITTIAGTKRSIGTIILDLSGHNITLQIGTGNTWVNTNKPPTINNSLKYAAAGTLPLCTKQYLYLLGDGTGSTAQIIVWDM